MSTNPNMEAIQTITVGATSVANITFSNIPQGYTDLKLVYSGRDNRADTQNGVNISLNGSTADFTGRELQGNGSAASSFSIARFVSYNSGANSTANTFANTEIYFPNYTSSNNKSFSADSVQENNATTAMAFMGAHLWSNSAAITSITLTPDSANFVQHSSATLYGVTSAGSGAKATGGAIYQDADYFYHAFFSSGTFTPTQNLSCDILVVAGGGGGSHGGGGAGGLTYYASQSLTATNYTCTVGAGGSGGPSNHTTRGTSGGNSQFASLTASVGGGTGGQGAIGIQTGVAGGSGGGGAPYAGGPYAGGSATSGQGFAGGTSGAASGAYAGGGGGGAGAIGGTGNSAVVGEGVGGVGSSTYSNWVIATGVGQVILGIGYIAAGGGGGADSGYAAVGGSGGGGLGSTSVGSNGQISTGSGGGGSSNTSGGAGGSGIVIVRYAK